MNEINSALRSLASGARRWVFPGHCVLCGGVDVENFFCADCRKDLPPIPHACNRCGVPVAGPLPVDTGCAACQLRPPPFRKARALLLYAFPVDAALKGLKFRRELHYAAAFAALLELELVRSFPDVDALVPVPLHRRRHALRGFNQAEELCRPLSRRHGLPIVRSVRRIRHTAPQTGLNSNQRRHNLRGAFTVTGALRCRRPLIVDDVMTTGETCRQLAKVLLAAGATSVDVLVVARAAPGTIHEFTNGTHVTAEP